MTLFEDDAAAHQIRLTVIRFKIAVSCTCLRTSGLGFAPLEARPVFPAREALAVWQAHADSAEEPAEDSSLIEFAALWRARDDRQGLAAAIDVLRARRVSWTVLAAEVGVSRQAVQQWRAGIDRARVPVAG